MAKEPKNKKTVFVAPTNIVKVIGDKKNSFGLDQDEKAIMIYVRDHGGIVPEARVKSEVNTESDISECIENIVRYGYAKLDRNKVILTNNGEYVAQEFRMEHISYK